MRDRSARTSGSRRLSIEDLEPRHLLATLVVDYSLDSNRFFSTSTANGRAARAALESAADLLSAKITDTLAAINPPGGNNTWTPRLQFHPSTGAQNYQVAPASANMKVPANQIIVYAGARNLNSLGAAGPGSLSYSYTSASWENTLLSRGEGNGTRSAVRGSSANEVAPWGGWVSFDRDRDWHYDHTTLPPSDKFDFYSVAVHELSHILGFGLVDAWDNLVSGTSFTGSKSRAEYDKSGNVPLDHGHHWADGTLDSGVETALDPILSIGMRKPLTALDYAGLDDIGWQVTAAPNLTLAASDSSISENGGKSTLTFSLSAAAKEPITVGIAISGSAEQGVDYRLSTEQVVIPAGRSSATLTITGIADTLAEGNESVAIEIVSVAGDAKESGNQRTTISIVDLPPPKVTLAAAPTSITENGDASELTLTLSNPALSDVKVDLTYGGTATRGSDYSGASTSVTIGKGSTSASFSLKGVLDSLVEGDETITVDIAAVSGGGASEQGTQRETIRLIDLPPPKLQLNAQRLMLGEDGDSSIITAMLDAPALEAVRVELAFAGSATRNSDYQISSGVIQIAAGQTNGSVKITTTADNVAEGDETALIEVASITGGAIENGKQSVELIIVEPGPVAQADRFIITQRTQTQTLDVLANDSAEAGGIDKVSVLTKSSPTGSISVNGQNQIEYTPPTDFVGMDRFRYLIQDEVGRESNEALVETFIVDLNAQTPFLNEDQPFDVNDDGVISPVDALLVINDLNNRSGASFDVPAFGFVDTDGNNAATPLDALLVINRLNQGGSGEGEAESFQAPIIDQIFDGWGADRKRRL